jgi:pyruvate formate lyase activating enzyme
LLLRLGDYLLPTTVDWPGKCAMIVWLAGCNFRCPFCQNASIIPRDSGREASLDEMKKIVRENTRWVDGVVFSGGEPTLQDAELTELVAYVKEMKRGVLLDTNGSRPEILEGLLSKKLVDHIALDYKGTPERYQECAGVTPKMAEKVHDSLALALDSDAYVEIRTTVVPGLVGPKDIEAISKIVSDCDVYYLQQFRPEGDLLDPELAGVTPPEPRELAKLARLAKKHVGKVGIKTREFGVQYF